MHPAQSRLAHTQEKALMRKQTVMRKLRASKGHARRSAQVSTARTLTVATLATSAPNAVAAAPPGALTWAPQPPVPTSARLFGQRRLGREASMLQAGTQPARRARSTQLRRTTPGQGTGGLSPRCQHLGAASPPPAWTARYTPSEE